MMLRLLKSLFYCYYALRQYKKATKVYDTLEQIDPNNPLLRQYDGNELLSSTFFQRLINRLTRGLQVLRGMGFGYRSYPCYLFVILWCKDDEKKATRILVVF